LYLEDKRYCVEDSMLHNIDTEIIFDMFVYSDFSLFSLLQ